MAENNGHGVRVCQQARVGSLATLFDIVCAHGRSSLCVCVCVCARACLGIHICILRFPATDLSSNAWMHGSTRLPMYMHLYATSQHVLV